LFVEKPIMEIEIKTKEAEADKVVYKVDHKGNQRNQGKN